MAQTQIRRLDGEGIRNLNGMLTELYNVKAVPKGAILMWSGILSTIPMGWHLCDGTFGTPNLLDKFILNVINDSENPGGIGGSNSHSHSLSVANLPAHTHGATGNHAHQFQVRSAGTQGTRVPSTYSGWSLQGYQNTESAGSHTHSNVGSGSSFSGNNKPKFYKLAFIMKL